MSIKEISTPMAFKFNATSNEVRSLIIGYEPFFVAKDICSILELSDTNKALAKLDVDEKLTRKIFVSGQNREMWLVSESGLYALIMRSNKPEAKVFRKWVTSEVLPSIRKKGYYAMHKPKDDFIDARDVPFYTKVINGYNVRCIDLATTTWVVINDVNKAIHSSTGSHQLSKKLNAKQVLAKKIWLFGNTHAAWCTNQLGLQLLLAGSRKFNSVNQLNLAL